ncbi:Hypothetical protein FKW44_004944, partial [Caligus rogercresseyi]
MCRHCPATLLSNTAKACDRKLKVCIAAFDFSAALQPLREGMHLIKCSEGSKDNGR